LINYRDNGRNVSAIRIDPGFLLHAPDTGKPIGAFTRMRAQTPVIMYGDVVSDVVAPVPRPGTLCITQKSGLSMGTIAKWLVAGFSATTQDNHFSIGLDFLAFGVAQRLQVLNQVWAVLFGFNYTTHGLPR
jgi:hypothetical protein